MILFHPDLHPAFVHAVRETVEEWAGKRNANDVLVIPLMPECPAFVGDPPGFTTYSKTLLRRTPIYVGANPDLRAILVEADGPFALEAINDWVRGNWRALRRKMIEAIDEAQP